MTRKTFVIASIVAIVCSTLGPWADSSPAAILIGKWSFESSDVNANDTSSNDNDGTFTNGASITTGDFAPVPSGSNASLLLDGINDYVSIPYISDYEFPTTGDGFSVAAWIKSTQTNRVDILGQGDAADSGSGQHWELTMRNDGATAPNSQISAFLDTGSGTPAAVISTLDGEFVNDGQWRHVAMTVDFANGQWTRYIDGTAAPTIDDPSVIAGLVSDPTAIFAIGRRGNRSGDYFGGLVDEVRLYSGVLTAAQVQALVAVPEPATGVLIVGLLAFAMRKRRNCR